MADRQHRPGSLTFWAYMRSQMRIGWAWIPAAGFSIWRVSRDIGWVLALILGIIGGSLAAIAAGYASWRWSQTHPPGSDIPTRYVVAVTLLVIAVGSALVLTWEWMSGD